MFRTLSGRPTRRLAGHFQNARRRARRRLIAEALEDRRVLALLGVEPLLQAPEIAYNNGGVASYDAQSDVFSVDATALTFDGQIFFPFGATPTFDINIEVDDTGMVVGGVSGDDLIVTGDLDLDFDFIPEFSGTLLTGEVIATPSPQFPPAGFGFQDGTGNFDDFDFRFVVTGGALAGFYAGKDLGVTLNLENSSFTGDFTTSFGGGPAKGDLGAIEPDVVVSNPSIDIEKSTNGFDADTPTGPNLIVGQTATFEYVVTNTGDVPLQSVSVVDDQGIVVSFVGGDVNNDSLLDLDEVWTFTASETVTAGQYANIGTVSAEDAGGQQVSDSDPSHHFGLVAAIDIMKLVDVNVVTEELVHLDFEGVAAGTIVDSQFPGVTISAVNRRVPSAGNRAMIFDSANPTGGDLDLGTPNQDFGGPGQGHGGGLSSSFPNDQALDNILIISEDGDASDPDDEARGGVFTFTFDEPVRIDQIELLDIDSNEAGGSVVTVTSSSGTQSFPVPALGNNSFQTLPIDVSDVTSLEVDFVSSGAITELKYTTFDEVKDWVDANEAPGVGFDVGDDITFTYKVTNPGDVEIENVLVVDDNASPGDGSDDFSPAFLGGDSDNDGLLDPGETWEYEATITATIVGQFTNLGQVEGNAAGDPDAMVEADDPANYQVFGLPGIAIEKLTNGFDADTPNGADTPEISPGDAVTWT
ncbi:MAG: hypothetical protein AAGD07_17030, partial [Planctomycetota bacterium]